MLAMLSIGAGAEEEALDLIARMGLRNIVVRAKPFEESEMQIIRHWVRTSVPGTLPKRHRRAPKSPPGGTHPGGQKDPQNLPRGIGGTSSKSPYVVVSSRSGPGSDKPLDASGSIFPQPRTTPLSPRLESPELPASFSQFPEKPLPTLIQAQICLKFTPPTTQTPRQPIFFANPPVTTARFRVGPLLEPFFNSGLRFLHNPG